jgi:hypothetical protein
MVNPVIGSLRGVIAASQLGRVQEDTCSRAASLGSLSEAQHLLNPELLEKLVAELSQESVTQSMDLACYSRKLRRVGSHGSPAGRMPEVFGMRVAAQRYMNEIDGLDVQISLYSRGDF